MAAGSVIAMVDTVANPKSQVNQGFCCVRPPGHHAQSDRTGGFCVFNNIAVAAHHARKIGFQRICILDWDVHHGNGTEDIFKSDDELLFVSFHRHQLPSE